jgi:ribosome-associated protein YbcJ (S4-like RNA binding protein)
MMALTGMEYTDGMMEEYITENTNRIRKMAKDIKGGQVEMNIGESGRITCNGERESNKRKKYFTETSMMESRSSAEVKYSDLIKSLSRNS